MTTGVREGIPPFLDRKFIVVHKDTIDDSKLAELEEILTQNGGELVHWKDRHDTDVANKLIIVASTAQYKHYEELRSLRVPTVTEDWIRASLEVGKIVPTQPFSPDPRDFMRDVMIYCCGLSDGDTYAIHSGVKAAGGDYCNVLSRYTSHVITLDPDHEACRTAHESALDIKVVSPLWFDDCIRLGIKIDAEPYLFENAGSDPMQSVKVPDLTGKYSQSQKDARRAVQNSVKTSLGSAIFEGRRFFFGRDLDVSPLLGKTLEFLVEINSGLVAKSLEDATVYIGRWRHSPEYIEASKRRLDVGNVLWLYYMVNQHAWESPLKHLLHYPEVESGLAEMHGLRICATNYTGTSRCYVQSLITSLGATYSSNLKMGESTHLVAAFPKGSKYDAAREWGIKIVNHLWLEDTYARWQRQDESDPKYTHFSPKINLAMVVDSTPLIRAVLKQFYEPEHAPRVVRRDPRVARKASRAAAEELQDAMDREVEFREEQRRKHHHNSDSDVDENENQPTREREEPPSKRRKTPESTLEGHADGTSLSKEAADIEVSVHAVTNETNGTGAADKANGNSEVSGAKGAHNNENGEAPRPDKPVKEPKKRQGAKKTASKQTRSVSPASSSASPSPASQNGRRLRVLFTGIDDPPTPKECSRIGLSKVENPPAQIVVAPRFLRTAKFLRALADAELFVTPQWIRACLKAGERVPTDSYKLETPQLTEAITNRARLNGDPLFDGMAFYIAPIIKAKSDIASQLIKAHGGSLSRGPGPGVITVGGPTLPFEEFLIAISTMTSASLQAKAEPVIPDE